MSDLLLFAFYELVHHHLPEAPHPASAEELGNFVGIADDCGDELTFLVLTKKGSIIPRSVLEARVRAALEKHDSTCQVGQQATTAMSPEITIS